MASNCTVQIINITTVLIYLDFSFVRQQGWGGGDGAQALEQQSEDLGNVKDENRSLEQPYWLPERHLRQGRPHWAGPPLGSWAKGP